MYKKIALGFLTMAVLFGIIQTPNAYAVATGIMYGLKPDGSARTEATDNNPSTVFTECTEMTFTLPYNYNVTGFYYNNNSDDHYMKLLDSSGTQVSYIGVSNRTGYTSLNVSPVRKVVVGISGGQCLYIKDVDLQGTSLPTDPLATTQSITSVNNVGATANGSVTALGTTSVTAYGFVWGTAANPTTALTTKVNLGSKSSTGTYNYAITGLNANTTYHVRAYATNSVGTAYGADMTFTTTAVAPTVTTSAASAVTQTTATGNGNVTALGGSSVTQFGHVWNTSASPTVALATKTTLGTKTATGAFTSPITGLFPNTTYYVRSYATNAAGTAYGSDVTFTTPAGPPVVTTGASSSITAISAKAAGTVNALGNGTVTQYGHVWSTSPSPTIADNKTTLGTKTATGAYTSTLASLIPNTTYYVSAYATNALGTAYGTEISFTTAKDATPPDAPVGLAADIGDEQVILSWTANTDFDLKSYKVYQDGVLLTTINAPTTTYTAIGLTNGTSYDFTVSAVDTSGNESAQSSVVSAIPAYDTTPPGEVTDATETHTGNSVTLTWTNPLDTDFKQVNVYKWNNTTSMWELISAP